MMIIMMIIKPIELFIRCKSSYYLCSYYSFKCNWTVQFGITIISISISSLIAALALLDWYLLLSLLSLLSLVVVVLLLSSLVLLDSLRGSSVKIGTKQRRLAKPLRKDDTHKSRRDHYWYYYRRRQAAHDPLPP